MSCVRHGKHCFNVYKVRDGPVIADPDMPGTRYHTFIYVETDFGGSGFKHHVTGDLVAGMHYERKKEQRPEESETFHDKQSLGSVTVSAYPACFDSILANLAPPPRQKAFNPATMRTEPVKPDGTFCSNDEARPRLVKCTEWIEVQAIPALYGAGALQRQVS